MNKEVTGDIEGLSLSTEETVVSDIEGLPDLEEEVGSACEIVAAQPKEKLWNNLYIKMLTIALFLSVCANMINTSLPLYVQQLGADKSIAGLVMGTFTIAALVCRPIYGNLVDMKGRKIVLLIGIAIVAVSILGFNLTTSIMMILALRAVMGVGFSGFSTAGGTVVADVLPSSRLSEGIGYYGISANLATAFGPQIALLLISVLGYNSVFITSLIVCIAGFFLVMTFNYEKKAKEALRAQAGYVEPPKTKVSLKTAFEKTAIPGSLTQFFLIMPMGFAMTFIPTFGITAGIDGIGNYFTVFALTLLATRFFVGRLADRYGVSKVMVPGMVLIVIGVSILGITANLMQVLIAAGFIGLGYGCVNPTMNAFIMKVSPLERRGAANATYYAAFDAGAGFGSMVGGVIVQSFGFQVTFFCLVGIVLVGIAFYFKFMRKQVNLTEA